jgi:ferritin
MKGAAIDKDRNVLTSSLYYRHFDQAERVRWRMCDIPWDTIDTKSVDRTWVNIVRIVFDSELTTFEATERFLKEWAGDVDFTQWLSVWLYEETKHPSALLRWLAAFGETVRPDEMVVARQTHPFVASRMATLCMNVMSELVASSLYVALWKYSPEPVLRTIGSYLAGDEARHATHFFNYAKKMVDEAPNAEERNRHVRDALMVLEFWIDTNKKVTHPVNLVFNRLRETEQAGSVLSPQLLSDEVLERARTKMFTLSRKLTGLPIQGVADIHNQLGALWAS